MAFVGIPQLMDLYVAENPRRFNGVPMSTSRHIQLSDGHNLIMNNLHLITKKKGTKK